MSDQKTVAFHTLSSRILSLEGKKVLVGGCFDIIHIGHIQFLQQAKKQGDILIVALESDKFIRKKKNREPFHTQKERAEILSRIVDVDRIVLLPYFEKEAEYDQLVVTVRPHVIAVSENDAFIEKKQQQAKRVGGKVVTVLSHIPQKASQNLLKALQELGV